MKFNHFRVFVTLLASFVAFFAYICRLNLSLTIDEMARENHDYFDYEVVDLVQGESKIKELRTHRFSSSFLQTEEQTMAWLWAPARSYMRQQKQRQNHSRQSKPTPASAQKRRAKHRIDRINFGSPLTVEFDVNLVGQQKSSESSTTPSPQETGETSNENSDVNANPTDQITIEPNAGRNYVDWDKKDRNTLLSAFFLGYVLSQIPGARAGEIFGAKSLFLVTGFGASLCSLVFPYAAKVSSTIWPAYAVRMLMGMTQGCLFPGCYVLLCEWLPPNERSKWLPVPSSFTRLGTIVMGLLVPIILREQNWEAVFYVCGLATLVTSFLFLIFGSNSPDQSYWISKQELIHIEAHMEPKVGTMAQPSTVMTASGFTINESATGESTNKRPSVSWWKLATNKAILILSLVMFTSEWSNMLLLIKLPGFLGPVFNMDVAEIGNWTSVFVAIYCIQYPLSGWLASKLEANENEWFSSLRVRKVFEVLAHVMQGLGCWVIAFSSDKSVVIAALALMMLGRATVGGGQCLMPPELSRDYPGTVFAFANTVANTAGLIGPECVSWLVADPSSHSSWQVLWIMSGALFLAGGFVFCILADNRPQNYGRKPKADKGLGNRSLSDAKLTTSKNAEEIFRMDAFSRVASEPRGPTEGLENRRRESRVI